jgi:hypothetical protein
MPNQYPLHVVGFDANEKIGLNLENAIASLSTSYSFRYRDRTSLVCQVFID